ncbi:MAG: triose-phosphate isomerase [SAR86 cluster bacterium]|nr:triose-phosphate isomerase [SAR86 cluster bacterium]
MKNFQIIANFKMNGSFDMISSWLDEVSLMPEDLQSRCILCPPMCFLKSTSNILYKRKLGINLGAQNVDADSDESLTGGVSAEMLLDAGCQYALIGHSERREKVGEKNEELSKKVASALKVGLKVIFCIGESKDEKLESKTFNVLESQLSFLEPFKIKDLKSSLLIAYEPIWAIGSGDTADPLIISETHNFIKNTLLKILDTNSIPILYGGSVLQDNAKSLSELKEVDGLLVGGASINPKEFINIVTKSQ